MVVIILLSCFRLCYKSFSVSFVKPRLCLLYQICTPRCSEAQCPTLWDAMDCSLSGSCVHWILQARISECIAIPFSRGSSWPMDQTQVSCMVGRSFTIWATRERKIPKWSSSRQHLTLSCLTYFYLQEDEFSCAAGQWPGATSWP